MIAREIIPEDCRADYAGEVFGVHFPLAIEPAIFNLADRLSSDYQGGYWQFYALSNGGFFMAPDSDTNFKVISENGYHGIMSAEAFGVTVCMYAYSHLGFSENDNLADQCGRQFHLLRDFMLDHAEAGAILAAID